MKVVLTVGMTGSGAGFENARRPALLGIVGDWGSHGENGKEMIVGIELDAANMAKMEGLLGSGIKRWGSELACRAEQVRITGEDKGTDWKRLGMA